MSCIFRGIKSVLTYDLLSAVIPSEEKRERAWKEDTLKDVTAQLKIQDGYQRDRRIQRAIEKTYMDENFDQKTLPQQVVEKLFTTHKAQELQALQASGIDATKDGPVLSQMCRSKTVERLGLTILLGSFLIMGTTMLLALTLPKSVNLKVQMGIGITGMIALIAGKTLHGLGQGGEAPKVRVIDVALATAIFVLGLAGFDTMIHEGAHALMAKALYHTTISITITPFKGGVTYWGGGDLTKLGALFGSNGSQALISVAGIGATTLLGIGELFAAKVVGKKSKTVRNMLYVHAFSLVLGMAQYGISALFARYRIPGHDFMSLQNGLNIHAMIMTGVLTGSVLSVSSLLQQIRRKRSVVGEAMRYEPVKTA